MNARPPKRRELADKLLDDMARAGFTIEADADRLVIRPASKLNDELRETLREVKSDLLAALRSRRRKRPYALTKAEAGTAHARPWSASAIARFSGRLGLALRRGFSGGDADDLAERLHLRDVQGDDRVLCVECSHLAGRPGAWACGNHHAADVGRDLPAALVTTMQRCAGFQSKG